VDLHCAATGLPAKESHRDGLKFLRTTTESNYILNSSFLSTLKSDSDFFHGHICAAGGRIKVAADFAHHRMGSNAPCKMHVRLHSIFVFDFDAHIQRQVRGAAPSSPGNIGIQRVCKRSSTSASCPERTTVVQDKSPLHATDNNYDNVPTLHSRCWVMRLQRLYKLVSPSSVRGGKNSTAKKGFPSPVLSAAATRSFNLPIMHRCRLTSCPSNYGGVEPASMFDFWYLVFHLAYA
jgi:hypothetical protein